jgi:phosphoenolpyruvate synthase/pyruvate phosphate dikinase
MKEHLGFSYKGHYFVSNEQKTTFFVNNKSRKLAEEYGKKRFSEKEFIRYFCDKSKIAEKELEKVNRKSNSLRLKLMNNKQLYKIFDSFFDKYSTVAGFYRFSRPEFYELAMANIKGKLKLELSKVGKRRLEMHASWMSAFNQAEKLFNEIGRRIGFSLIETLNLTHDEIKNALINNIKPKGIDKRVKNFVFIYQGDSFVIKSSKKVDERKHAFSVIRGKVAYKGLVRGRVFVVSESLRGINARKIREMKKNSVLVTEMTSPDMIALINKASAIVTDDGGILCHAAVISRELKKPCIIGTKIATKVLKDGDLVEVDANKGIVRKIIGKEYK